MFWAVPIVIELIASIAGSNVLEGKGLKLLPKQQLQSARRAYPSGGS